MARGIIPPARPRTKVEPPIATAPVPEVNAPPLKSRGKMTTPPLAQSKSVRAAKIEAPIAASAVPETPARKPPHRPPYEPTDKDRSNVAAMIVANIDQRTIAACLKISEPTLRKHFRRELDVSYAIILADIAGKLVTKARNGDLKAQIFYLETHGWVRAERVMVEDAGDLDVSTLSDAEIEARIAKLSRRGKG